MGNPDCIIIKASTWRGKPLGLYVKGFYYDLIGLHQLIYCPVYGTLAEIGMAVGMVPDFMTCPFYLFGKFRVVPDPTPVKEEGRLYLVVFLQMMGGYLLGFAITTLLGLDYAASITMTYAATMRNNGAGILIAVSYFSPLMALPITLNTLIQQPIASTIYKFYRPWRARRDGRLRSLGGA